MEAVTTFVTNSITKSVTYSVTHSVIIAVTNLCVITMCCHIISWLRNKHIKIKYQCVCVCSQFGFWDYIIFSLATMSAQEAAIVLCYYCIDLQCGKHKQQFQKLK